MTTALNRKFDLLSRSGTCPAYLMDVLSLLVVHANDTELYKSECRSADAAAPCVAPAMVTRNDDTAEQDAAERRLALVRKQAEDPEELDAAIRASHETVLLAAEHSLRTYAENLKRANDIALAAAEKQLRALRVETRAELEQFKKLALKSTVEETRNELDLLRADWFAETKAEVAQLRASLHQVGLAAQAEVRDLTSGYSQFVTDTYAVVSSEPLVEAHRHAGSSLLMEEQVDAMVRTMAKAEDVTALEERIKALEKTNARLAARAPQKETRSRESPSRSAAETPPTNRSTPTTPTPQADTSVLTGRADRTQPAGPSRSTPTSPPTAALASQTSQEVPTAESSAGRRIGLSVQNGRNGLCVVAVDPASQAFQKGIAIGSIISHVGRVHVTTAEAYSQATEEAAAIDGGAIKLTIYDPLAARVRVVAF